MRHTLLSLAVVIGIAAPASAQALKLSFDEGRVSLDATAVPVRTILSEWAKLGGTQVMGADRVSGAPLTLKLVDVPESQALDVVLRSVAGYMAAPRKTAGAGGSMYDRILVMATSTPPATPSVSRPGATSPSTPNTPRIVGPRPPPNRAVEDVADEEDPTPPNPPVFTFPQPANGAAQPGVFVNAPPGTVNAQPLITINPATGAPTYIVSPAPVPGPTPTAPIGAPVPGVVIQPIQPGQVPPGIRPPGV